jgi:hypothetical protein
MYANVWYPHVISHFSLSPKKQGLTNDIFGPYVGDAGFDPAGFAAWCFQPWREGMAMGEDPDNMGGLTNNYQQ